MTSHLHWGQFPVCVGCAAADNAVVPGLWVAYNAPIVDGWSSEGVIVRGTRVSPPLCAFHAGMREEWFGQRVALRENGWTVERVERS